MPFAENWLEELVAEWLQLEGYLVEIGLPVSVAKAGGRYPADVVGARIKDNTLEVAHIECGQLSGGQRSVNSLKKKFSPDNCTRIEKYFKKRLEFAEEKVNYNKIYVASFWSKPTMQGAKNLGINVIPLSDFIRNHVAQTIQKWKDNPPQEPRTKGSHITLPESCWLLQLIDYLYRKGLLHAYELSEKR